MNPFETLGIEPRLVIEREELNQALREAGKAAHPDAGGSEESFAQVQAAHDVLQSPAKRLKAWLDFMGVEAEARGSIGTHLMDEFGPVGEVTMQAEAIIRERDAAQTALAKAMLENETQLCREALEATMARIEGHMDDICSGFAELEQADSVGADAAEWHRDLSFLEKWQLSLRALYAKLV